jgi:hypothetical protein
VPDARPRTRLPSAGLVFNRRIAASSAVLVAVAIKRSNLDAVINTLEDRERLIVRLYFQGGLMQSQIGSASPRCTSPGCCGAR